MPRARNTATTPEAEALDAAAKAFTRAEAQLQRARDDLHARMLAAIRAGMSRAEAGRRAGYSREYVSGLVKADAQRRTDQP